MDMGVDGLIDALKRDLLRITNQEKNLQKHFLDRKCLFFSEILGNEDKEYEFRAAFAMGCNVNISDVIIVGSAKVGFSIKTANFKKFDEGCDDEGRVRKSDIDVAIINRDFFDKVGYDLFKFSRHFDREWIIENWRSNRFYSDPGRPLFDSYARYLAKGWLRPDFMPDKFLNQQEFFKKAGEWRTNLSGRKVSVGIYSGWNFFKFYHMDNLENIRALLKSGSAL